MDLIKDRRVRKSKEALKNSLIELMREKSVNNITVKELVTRADLCQYLLNKGYTIVSIARNKYDRNQTVFYFRNENEILKEIKNFKK